MRVLSLVLLLLRRGGMAVMFGSATAADADTAVAAGGLGVRTRWRSSIGMRMRFIGGETERFESFARRCAALGFVAVVVVLVPLYASSNFSISRLLASV